MSTGPSWETAPLRLRPSVELVVGAEGLPLLHDAESQRYVRLSITSLPVVDLLDGARTVTDLARLMADGDDSTLVEGQLRHFFSRLADAGMLEGAPGSQRAASGELPGLEWPLTRSAGAVAEPLARLWTSVPGTVRTAATILLVPGSLCAFLGVWNAPVLADPAGAPLGLALVALGAQTVGHELAHAVAAAAQGARASEAGLTLWMYVLPGAYVVVPGMHGLQSRRARVEVALAGPAWDLVCLSLWSLTSALGGALGAVAGWAALGTAVRLTWQFNPLLPSDGLRAVEAALGVPHFRSRAVRAFRDWSMGRGLDPSVQRAPGGVGAHLVYGALSWGFGAMLLGSGLVALATGLLGGLR